ncbi:MAG: hypothetical protein ACK4RK_12930 [Gemmataceae bacterium]
MPADLQQVLSFSLHLNHLQQLGLAFLLGSFAVATLSDLRRLSAQQEFREIWLLFLLAVLIRDGYEIQQGSETFTVMVIKWGLILLLSVLSVRQVGVLFRLATGDVAALAAAACLLTPVLIVIFYLLAKVLAWIIGPMLARGRNVWPFMPVVSLATLAVLVLGLLL